MTRERDKTMTIKDIETRPHEGMFADITKMLPEVYTNSEINDLAFFISADMTEAMKRHADETAGPGKWEEGSGMETIAVHCASLILIGFAL
jgi:hypothetical protein